MKKIFYILILIVAFQFTYCQDSIPYTNKGFVISYKIKKIDESHSSISLAIKNSSNENRYISITENKLLKIESEKRAFFFDLSNRWNTDPLMSPKMLFYFAQIKKGEIYETTRIIYNSNATLLNVNLEYFSDLEKTAKKLKIKDSKKSIFTLKCKQYVDSAYTKGEIKTLSQTFLL